MTVAPAPLPVFGILQIPCAWISTDCDASLGDICALNLGALHLQEVKHKVHVLDVTSDLEIHFKKSDKNIFQGDHPLNS